jgi:hypothetical protein
MTRVKYFVCCFVFLKAVFNNPTGWKHLLFLRSSVQYCLKRDCFGHKASIMEKISIIPSFIHNKNNSNENTKVILYFNYGFRFMKQNVWKYKETLIWIMYKHTGSDFSPAIISLRFWLSWGVKHCRLVVITKDSGEPIHPIPIRR